MTEIYLLYHDKLQYFKQNNWQVRVFMIMLGCKNILQRHSIVFAFTHFKSILPWHITCLFYHDILHVFFTMTYYMSIFPWHITCLFCHDITCLFRHDILHVCFTITYYMCVLPWHITCMFYHDMLFVYFTRPNCILGFAMKDSISVLS